MNQRLRKYLVCISRDDGDSYEDAKIGYAQSFVKAVQLLVDCQEFLTVKVVEFETQEICYFITGGGFIQ